MSRVSTPGGDIRTVDILPEKDSLFHIYINSYTPGSVTRDVDKLKLVGTKGQGLLSLTNFYINPAGLVGDTIEFGPSTFTGFNSRGIQLMGN